VLKTAGLVAAGAAIVASSLVVGRRVVRRRQTAGAQRIGDTLHLNARWWKEQSAREGELLYVAVGDSAAQGIGASRPGRGYVGVIAAHLRQRTGRSIRVLNLSVSGARLREAIAVQLPALEGLHPDVMTVAIGANDIADFDRTRFENELAIVFDALPSGAIVSELPSFYFGGAERHVREANAIVHRLAALHGLEVAPLHLRTKRQGGVLYAFNQVAADFFHPNDRGYRVWASAFIPLLDRRFPATASPR
jgi:acyl-CoA thioesterase-1